MSLRVVDHDQRLAAGTDLRLDGGNYAFCDLSGNWIDHGQIIPSLRYQVCLLVASGFLVLQLELELQPQGDV